MIPPRTYLQHIVPFQETQMTKKSNHILSDIHCVCVLSAQSCMTLCHPLDCSLRAPLSMGFSRQEYWSGLPFPPPGDLPVPGNEPASPVAPALQADSLPTEPSGKPYKQCGGIHLEISRSLNYSATVLRSCYCRSWRRYRETYTRPFFPFVLTGVISV